MLVIVREITVGSVRAVIRAVARDPCKRLQRSQPSKHWVSSAARSLTCHGNTPLALPAILPSPPGGPRRPVRTDPRCTCCQAEFSILRPSAIVLFLDLGGLRNFHIVAEWFMSYLDKPRLCEGDISLMRRHSLMRGGEVENDACSRSENS